MDVEHMIERARRIVAGEFVPENVKTSKRQWAEALLAEHDTRVAAERRAEQAARFGESTQDWLRARAAALEAALGTLRDGMDRCHAEAREPTLDELVEWDDVVRAALGDQEAPTEPRVDDPENGTYPTYPVPLFEPGVHAGCGRNGVTVTGPEWLLDVRSRREVSLDGCIAETVVALWAAGIVTLGSCCGHGERPPSLVLGDHQDAMEAESLLRRLDPDRSWALHQWRLVPAALGDQEAPTEPLDWEKHAQVALEAMADAAPQVAPEPEPNPEWAVANLTIPKDATPRPAPLVEGERG